MSFSAEVHGRLELFKLSHLLARREPRGMLDYKVNFQKGAIIHCSQPAD